MSLVSFQSLQKSVQLEIIEFPKKPWTFHEKVEWLKAFDGRVTAVRKAASQALQEVDADLTARPFYDWDWIKHIITFGLGGIFADRREELETARLAVEQAVDGFFQRFAGAVHATQEEAAVDVVAACTVVLQHRPQEVGVVATLGARFLKEDAYRDAELLFLEVLKRGHSNGAYLYLVDALIKQEKFKEAEEKIAEWTLKSSPADLKQFATQFELKKVECQAGQNRFDDAMKALFDMIRTQPHERALKNQVVQLSVKKEIKKFQEADEWSDVQRAHFMDQARKFYGQLDAYAASAWSTETERSDLDFWIWLLFSQTEIVRSNKLHSLALEKCKEVILRGVVAPATVIDQLGKFVRHSTALHLEFTTAFKALAVDGAQANRIEALFKAKIAKLFERLNGTRHSVGLEPTRRIAGELLEFLKKGERFQENAIQMQIATLEMELKSNAKEVELCKETARKEQHRLPAAIEAPPALLAIQA